MPIEAPCQAVRNILSCRCITLHVSAKLIASKGEGNAHYFAHFNAPDCEHSLETSLHFAAKKILGRKETFELPALTYNFVSWDICNK